MPPSDVQPLAYGTDAPPPPKPIRRFLCGVFGLVLTLTGGLGVIGFAIGIVMRWRFDVVMSRDDVIWQYVSGAMSTVSLILGVYLLRRRFSRTR